VGRYTECTFERAGKVARAPPEKLGELRNANSSGKVGVDMRNEPAGLPSSESETSACDLSLYRGQRTRDGRSEARLSVKKRKRVRDVRSCRFAVTITGSAYSFDELSRNDRQVV
jgi:hypothetical protein